MVMEEEIDVRIKSFHPPLREENAYKVFLQLWSVKKEICKKKVKVRNVLPLFIPVTSPALLIWFSVATHPSPIGLSAFTAIFSSRLMGTYNRGFYARARPFIWKEGCEQQKGMTSEKIWKM
jgi:hypothetical protein